MDTQNQYDLRILRAIRRITRSIALHSRQWAAYSNITAPQRVCLSTVIDSGPLTATAIRRQLDVSPSTAVCILDRVEDKVLIQRERGREERRIGYITATETGRALAAETPSTVQKKLAQALKQSTESEQADITAALEKVVCLIDSETDVVTSSAGDAASTLLEVPDGAVPPESGLVV